jgi:hypothetical protein
VGVAEIGSVTPVGLLAWLKDQEPDHRLAMTTRGAMIKAIFRLRQQGYLDMGSENPEDEE